MNIDSVEAVQSAATLMTIVTTVFWGCCESYDSLAMERLKRSNISIAYLISLWSIQSNRSLYSQHL